MSNYAISLKRTGLLLAAVTFTALLMVVNLASFFGSVSAAQLTDRSLTLSSTLDNTNTAGAAGSETNGAAATHTVAFTTITDTDVDEVRLTYCTNAIGTCVAPTGLVLSTTSAQGTVTLSSDGGTNNVATIDLTPDWTTETAHSVSLTGVANPDYITPNGTSDTDVNTFFVRVTTLDAGSAAIDEGTVASAVTSGVFITTRVAETLGFSTTGTIDTTNVPAEGTGCVALTGSGAIFLGDPTEHTLALDTAYDNYSAFRVYTNASNGVSVTYEGETLTKAGGDIIDALTAETLSVEASEQFGLAVHTTAGGTSLTSNSLSGANNIVATNVDAAADITGGDPGEIVISTDYDEGAGIIDTDGAEDARFNFDAGTVTEIASSTGYVECGTALVRYLANISPTTEAGTYTTVIVYSAVPEY